MINLSHLPTEIQHDIQDIGRIPAVPTILEVICQTTGMGFAAIARVTENKWIICSVKDEIQFGLEVGGELKLETTICDEIRQSGNGVIIDCVDTDPHFSTHHTPAMYGFQSYISIPIIRKDGSFFGTLCAIDPRPAKLNNPQIIGMFNLYADLISFHLNALEKLGETESRLAEIEKTAKLREQFIAILGHDLRNPVGAVLNSAQMLLRMPLDERAMRLAQIAKDSSYRIIGLIENVLDFARGHLGDGIGINADFNPNMEEPLNLVITELQSVSPNRKIIVNYDFNEPVYCDSKRISQLFSNLLGNAITHGEPDSPIKITASSHNGEFKLAVSNGGERIPDAAMDQLFQPFSRGEVKAGQQGLGLGLYIASEIAKAHKGRIDVISNDEQTSFTFRFPFSLPLTGQ